MARGMIVYMKFLRMKCTVACSYQDSVAALVNSDHINCILSISLRGKCITINTNAAKKHRRSHSSDCVNPSGKWLFHWASNHCRSKNTARHVSPLLENGPLCHCLCECVSIWISIENLSLLFFDLQWAHIDIFAHKSFDVLVFVVDLLFYHAIVGHIAIHVSCGNMAVSH